MRLAPLLATTILSACGSGADAAPAPSGDGVRFEASAATRAELGVSAWIVTHADGALDVRGDAAGDAAAVGLDVAWSPSADAYQARYHVRRGADAADVTVRIARTSADAASVDVENGVAAASPALRRAYALLAADLAAGLAPPGAGSTPLLEQSVRPQDSQQVLMCRNQTLTQCPTMLSCGQTLGRCASIVSSCPTGLSVGSVLIAGAGDVLGDVIEGKPVSPISDCWNAVKDLGQCNDVEPQCNPANAAQCNSAANDTCSRQCTTILNQPCNAGAGTPSCDSLNAQEAQCKSDCLKCYGAR